MRVGKMVLIKYQVYKFWPTWQQFLLEAGFDETSSEKRYRLMNESAAKNKKPKRLINKSCGYKLTRRNIIFDMISMICVTG